MTTIVYKKSYPTPPIDKIEALRYAGVRGDAPEISALLDECISEATAHISYKLCYAYYPISRDGGRVDLGFAEVCSDRLAAHLEGCYGVILLAATIGISFDRLVAKEIKPKGSMLKLCADGLEQSVFVLGVIFYFTHSEVPFLYVFLLNLTCLVNVSCHLLRICGI